MMQTVIDGFQKCFQRMSETRRFDPNEMKNLMEPIFERAGYRRLRNERTNILLIHDSGVGDFVNKSAAIREIRRLYPNAHITLIIFPRALDLAEHCPYVDEIIPNARACDWHNLAEMYRWNLALASRLLRRRIDLCYAFTQYPSTILLAYMSGARERISYKFTREDGAIECGPFYIFSPLLTVEVPPQLFGTHSVENALALVDFTLHAPVANREMEIWLAPLDVSNVEELLSAELSSGKKIYALCMGGTAPRKQWLPQKYAQLAEKILKREPDVKFIILGGGPMDEQSAAIFKQSIDQKYLERVTDLTNKLNYRQSAAALKLCSLYVGNDTATLHIAAALKVPVLSMNCFAADLPMTDASILKVFHPYRVPSVIVQPKHALDECRNSTEGYGCTHIERHCIGQIEVETVFKAYRRLKKRIAENSLEPLFVS